MYYPTGRFLILIALPLLLLIPLLAFTGTVSIMEIESPLAWSSLGLINALLFLLFWLDGFTIPRKKRFHVIRESERIFSINFPHSITLHIDMHSGLRRSIRVRIFDDATQIMHVEEFLHDVVLRTGRNTLHYKLRIPERGNFKLQYLYLTSFSLLGLVRKVYRINCVSDILVYPDLKAVSKYALLARKSHLGLMGIRRARRAGGDNEFERLREYQRDDEFRHIDWKASARQKNLIVRIYQQTQNQTIIFMLDCGRMMTAEFEGRSLLDYALNSLLLLSHVALSQGDRVGLLAFGSNIKRYVRPAAGLNHHRRLVQATYDLTAEHEESNFDFAFQYLNNVSRKRSLVCMITNVIDTMNAQQLHSYLGSLAGRHLPFGVLLKEHDIHNLVESPPIDTEDMFIQAAASDFLLWKEGVAQNLKNRNVLVMESFPEDLDAAIINEYLRIKAHKLL